MIRKEAWLFFRTISGVRLCWVLKEPKGPKGQGCRRGRTETPTPLDQPWLSQVFRAPSLLTLFIVHAETLPDLVNRHEQSRLQGGADCPWRRNTPGLFCGKPRVLQLLTNFELSRQAQNRFFPWKVRFVSLPGRLNSSSLGAPSSSFPMKLSLRAGPLARERFSSKSRAAKER